MTTRYWYTPAGGDWQSSTWYVLSGGGLSPSTRPVSGDTVLLYNGNVTFSAADSTSYGALDGLTIQFANSTQTFSVDSATVTSSTTIETLYNAVPGTVSLSGTTSFAGAAEGLVSNGVLTLALQTNGTLNLTSTGLILARNGGSVTVTGATGARLSNAGTIEAGYPLSGVNPEFGAVSIGATLTNSGQLLATTAATLALTAGVKNSGTIANTSGTVTISGGVTNSGFITNTSGTLSLAGGVTNTGTITEAGGTLTIASALANNGLVQDNSGLLSITGAVTGTGTIAIADSQTLTLPSSVAAGQTISFASGLGTLNIGSPASFAGTVAGLTGHDIIDLQGVANATATVSGTTVTVSAGGSVVTTFSATGVSGGLSTVSDRNGGTFLTVKQTGTDATRYWNNASGSDWQTGTWYRLSGGTLFPYIDPASGDTVQLLNGNLTFSAADSTSYGALDGLTLIFAGTPIFSVDSATITATTTIETVFTNNAGTLSLSGTTSFAGAAEGRLGSAALTLALQSNATVNLTSTGLILARNAGSVSVTGATGAVLNNAGTIQAGYQVAANSFEVGAVSIAAALTNSGTILVTTFGTVSLTNGLTNSGQVLVNTLGTLSLTGGVTNTGTITDAGGTLTIAALVNNGLIQDTGGAVSITGALSGTGTIAIADSQTLALGGSVAAGQTISFATGLGTLDIGAPASFAGTVTGMSGLDVIDLQGLANATATVSGNSVTIRAGGSVVTTFTATGVSAGFSSVTDGAGGTFLTLKQTGAAATRYWNTAAGGDWQTGTWYALNNSNTLVASVAPAVGNTVQLYSGNVSFSAADSTSYGALDGLSILFNGTPVFSVDSATVTASTTIETQFAGKGGTLSLSGTTSFAGAAEGLVSDGLFTIALQPSATLDLTSTGLILARNAGGVAVTGATGALLKSAGTIQAGYSLGATSFELGAVSIAAALSNSGQILATTFGTLTLSGAVTNSGTITDAGGTITLGGSGVVTNSGTITDAGGTLTIAGALVNNGLVQDNSGVMSITGGVSGTGTITIGAGQTLALAGSVGAGQTISFATGVGTVDIGSPAGFAGTIAGMTGHDIIDLQGLANATASVSGSTVTVKVGGTTVTTFTATGLSGALNSVSDGNGGTILTLKQPGTQAAVVNTEINGATGNAARSWGPGGTVVTYSFAPASNWTATEKQTFINGLGLWSAVANISFVQATSGTGQLVFQRGTDGQAYSSFTAFSGVTQNDTVSIDTSVGSWTNLSSIGTADTTGYGGYGWLTVLHEEGHVLGLNHPGNYDETADLATQQTYYTDTHQYSVMSYFSADQSGANWTRNGVAYSSDTPMLFDIAAAQQIYGANTTTLAGGDTFGFNASASITGNAALNAVYNYSNNLLPIETIWDAGINNTLDLSGYSTAETINLNAGAFSSFNGITNNLAIASNTRIDTAIGGGGDDIFYLNGNSDTIFGGAGTNTAVFSGARAAYSISSNNGTILVSSGGTTDHLVNIQMAQFSDTTVNLACFVTGTRIGTADGSVAVERLAEGDRVMTADGAVRRVIWLGHRTVDCARHPDPEQVWPVRVRAGAFGDNMPASDLLLSPDHAVFAEGVLIPVRHLLTEGMIAQERWDRVTYWHVELERHDVLLANGLPCESYLDTGQRDSFDNGTAPMRLHADFGPGGLPAEPCARIVMQGPVIERLRRLVAGRAGAKLAA